MKLLRAAAVVGIVLVASPVFAQLAPPRADGLTFGQVALNVKDLAAHKKLWVEQFEGVLVEKNGVNVFDAIVALRDTEHVGVLMVEQNATEALRISDRAYVLSMGQVALEGAAADLLASDEMRRLYLGGRTH